MLGGGTAAFLSPPGLEVPVAEPAARSGQRQSWSVRAAGLVRRPPPHPGGGGPQRGGVQRIAAPTPHELEIRRRQQQLLRQQQLQQQQQQLQQHQQQQQQQQQQPAPPQVARQPPTQPRGSGRGRATAALAAAVQQQLQQLTPQELQHMQQQQQQQRNSSALPEDIWQGLAAAAGLEPGWRPQVALLYRVGLRADDFRRLASSRPEVFQMGLSNMKRKLRFLRDVVGLREAEMVKVLARFPRVLEYQSERTLRPRLDFLHVECGVPQEDLSKVVVKAPMVLELSVADTLAPRAAFLREEASLPPASLGKLILRHPQVLTCTEDMMRQRIVFLRHDCGLSSSEVGRAVLAHPQVLHYKIESMRERVDFLTSIGMTPQQVAAALARFPQLISLNVPDNMGPKWRYLVEQLGGDVGTLCAYPGYFSLSLHNRIVPRHRFLQHAREDPDVAFPLGHLKCSDKQFAVEVAGATLAEYTEFRAALQAEAGIVISGGGGVESVEDGD